MHGGLFGGCRASVDTDVTSRHLSVHIFAKPLGPARQVRPARALPTSTSLTEIPPQLSMAFLVLLEALSPVERAVFMLREVFGYGYPDVARITGKTEVNCRQIFARARQRIAAGGQVRDSAPSPARRAEGEELARRFFEAAAGGDMDALLGMLAPDVVLHGGRRRQGAGDREAAGRAAARHAAARRPAPPGPGPSAPPTGWPGSTASRAP